MLFFNLTLIMHRQPGILISPKNEKQNSNHTITESIGNLGEKIWNLVLVHMKDLKALSKFNN